MSIKNIISWLIIGCFCIVMVGYLFYIACIISPWILVIMFGAVGAIWLLMWALGNVGCM
jgi:hypothetical protein